MNVAHKQGETWLVVASTNAALVNLVAAAVTGIEQYDRILFLTGADPAKRSNTRDIEAQRGFDRLLTALEYEAGRRGLNWWLPEPDELTEDMNDPAPWPGKLAEFFGPSGRGKNARRIDLAILANDQLYIAEAKSAVPGSAKSDIGTLSALRKQVVGPPRIGKAWFVCGEPAGNVDVRREMAEHQDVELVVGKAEIDHLIGKLPEIVA